MREVRNDNDTTTENALGNISDTAWNKKKKTERTQPPTQYVSLEMFCSKQLHSRVALHTWRSYTLA